MFISLGARIQQRPEIERFTQDSEYSSAPSTSSSGQGAVHAHSAATVSQSYIINPTTLFEKDTAYLHGSAAKVVDNSEEAEVQFEENQRLLREHMQEVQEN